MDAKRKERVLSVGQELLSKLDIKEQHIIVAVLAKIIEQQDCEPLMVLEEGCSVHSDDDLEHFMLYAGFDYPDAFRIKAYVECLLDDNIS